jgi:hypothetical protein
VHVGGQIDWRLLPDPAGGFVDPFVGIGAGVFRFRSDDVNVVTGGDVVLRIPGELGSEFALSPTVGANFTLWKGLPFGIRGDIKDVVVFNREESDFTTGAIASRTTHNWVAEGGLSLSF